MRVESGTCFQLWFLHRGPRACPSRPLDSSGFVDATGSGDGSLATSTCFARILMPEHPLYGRFGVHISEGWAALRTLLWRCVHPSVSDTAKKQRQELTSCYRFVKRDRILDLLCARLKAGGSLRINAQSHEPPTRDPTPPPPPNSWVAATARRGCPPTSQTTRTCQGPSNPCHGTTTTTRKKNTIHLCENPVATAVSAHQQHVRMARAPRQPPELCDEA